MTPRLTLNHHALLGCARKYVALLNQVVQAGDECRTGTLYQNR